MRLNSYNLNGYELDLDIDVLRRYAELVSEPLHSDALNSSLTHIAVVMANTENFECAVLKHGKEELSRIIMEAVLRELNTFHIEES